MCGIAGHLGFGESVTIDGAMLTRMRDTMVHRGPDGGSLWISGNGQVGLAHRRLAIIDLSDSAIQPMCDASGRIVITFNGEVYNHASLRRQLEQAGRHFKTDHSDTEVLVEGFGHWGIEGLIERIEGDYAFAIWDGNEKALYLVRDRIGVKPLYFWVGKDRVIFASEMKAILAHPQVKAAVEPLALYHYLTCLTTPAPLTMFEGIYKIPPGYFIRISMSGEIKAKQYWDALPGRGIPAGTLEGMSENRQIEYCTNGILDRLTAAVEKRMMSDVPFGVFLSGGIDSSTNVALMTRYTSEPVRTFTVGFADYKHLNELEYARAVADRYKTDHREVLIGEKDMVGYLDKLVYHQDEPIADWVCIPLYFVSKLARDSGVTVVQVGEGSDEQFCGYDGYMQYLDLYRRYWAPFRKYVPGPLQKAAAVGARWASRGRPHRQVYADVIDRAARNREHFWGGAMVFWNMIKSDLIDGSKVAASAAAHRLVDWGLLDASWLETDTWCVFESYFNRIDKEAPGSDVLTRMIYSEFKYRLPELLLMRVDKVGMSVSIEPRVPFLDHHLVEFSMDIPMNLKVHNNVPKYLLKKAVEPLLPHEVIYRKKMGFGAPMAEWMRGDFGAQVERVLMDSRLFKSMPFNRSYIKHLIDEHRSGRSNNSLYLWSLFNLAAWYDYWIDNSSEQVAA
jgi:asparagine synthase (glutamine-hydrolysing)